MRFLLEKGAIYWAQVVTSGQELMARREELSPELRCIHLFILVAIKVHINIDMSFYRGVKM